MLDAINNELEFRITHVSIAALFAISILISDQYKSIVIKINVCECNCCNYLK